MGCVKDRMRDEDIKIDTPGQEAEVKEAKSDWVSSVSSADDPLVVSPWVKVPP